MMENMMDGAFWMGGVMLLWIILIIWFLIFTIIVLVKLNKISKQLKK
jgi:hypothetical protein